MTDGAIPRVVIVGAGFGGLTAAGRLAKLSLRLTLIDRKNHHTFQPLLYQVATAGLSPGEIAAPIRWVVRGSPNVEVLLGEVQDFDLARRMVKLPDLEIPYDYLIVAAGAGHSYFGHDEWEPLAPGLKTIEDALEIRRRVLLAFELAERQALHGRGPMPTARWPCSKESYAIKVAAAVLSIWNTSPMRKWPSNRWKLWPNRPLKTSRSAT